MSDLQSIHTNSFPQLLEYLGISLVVSTYQAGKLIVIRNDSELINTHFRNFPKPMGIAVTNGKIALGTGYQIWQLYNVPAVTNRLKPPGKHDACYLPRTIVQNDRYSIMLSASEASGTKHLGGILPYAKMTDIV